MKKNTAIAFALMGWFAIIAQYILMLENRVAPVLETTIRFFSFFTIQVNILVATALTFLFAGTNNVFNKPGILTAITAYITIVGLVYQIILRGIWEPTGLQKWVDEILHSVMPLLTIVFWYLFEDKANVRYSNLKYWLIYPLFYLVYTLIRGSISNFYPYPFVNVGAIGLQKVLFNSAILMLIFVAFCGLYIWMGKRISQKSSAIR